MGFTVAVIGGGDASAEALEWLLRGSPFAVVTAARPTASPDSGAGAGAARPSPAHHARELLNRVAMLTQCLLLADVTDCERRQWPSDIADANRLDALYAGGVSRSFRGEPTRSHRHPEAGAV